jgi:hypothetical protein
MEMGGFRGRPGGGPLILAEQHGLILADGQVVLGGGPTESPFPTVSKGAFAADLILELFGLVLGLIGLQVPKSAQNGFVKIIERMIENEAFRDAFAALLKGLRSGSWKAILEFFEALEGMGNLSELFAHVFSNLSGWDFLVTFLKLVAWLAAVVAGPGTVAMVAKLAELVLDLVGLGLKMHEMEKLGW